MQDTCMHKAGNNHEQHSHYNCRFGTETGKSFLSGQNTGNQQYTQSSKEYNISPDFGKEQHRKHHEYGDNCYPGIQVESPKNKLIHIGICF